MTLGGKWERLKGRVPLIRLDGETHLAHLLPQGEKENTRVMRGLDPRICRSRRGGRIKSGHDGFVNRAIAMRWPGKSARRFRFRCLAAGCLLRPVPALGHELVELGLVAGLAQALEEFGKFLLLLL